MQEKETIESNAFYGKKSNLLSELVPQFLAYGQYECSFAKETIQKYGECLGWIIKDIGGIGMVKAVFIKTQGWKPCFVCHLWHEAKTNQI